MSPHVYRSITAITAAFAKNGIAKDRLNLEDDYAYRSIDDVLIRLSPLLAKHRLCVLPRVLERSVTERQGVAGELLLNVSVRVAYDLVSTQDGSSHTIESYGEALDASDKATAKALQSAYKYAMLQAFAIPVAGSEDADARSPRLKQSPLPTEPVQGWQQWCDDVTEMIRICETTQAIDRVQQMHRPTLAALQRERADLYAAIGQTIAERRAELHKPVTADATAPAGETVEIARSSAAEAKLPVAEVPANGPAMLQRTKPARMQRKEPVDA